jgi:uncharacterized repeat protein (TIGR03803 family)
MTPTGTLTPLDSFDIADGDDPEGALVEAADGEFYGTTIAPNDAGTIFKVSPTGTLTTFYSFCSQLGCTDGAEPYAGLIQGSRISMPDDSCRHVEGSLKWRYKRAFISGQSIRIWWEPQAPMGE